MEYITSKGTTLPKTQLEMENSDWFNMWEKQNFPYKELLKGDILYWLDTVEKCILWKTEVVEVERFSYLDKNEIYKKYKNSMSEKYFDSRPKKGYFLHYRIKVLKQMALPKPNYNFSQLGWERMDLENSERWFNSAFVEDSTVIDSAIDSSENSIKKILLELNSKMKDVSPIRIKQLILTTIRKDTKFINTLKKAADYKCQFPNCGHKIKTKRGGFYIEVAHIEAVHKGGQSILGNLIVLCPNHHKEFDHGELIIREQTDDNLSGSLNGKEFEINLDAYN